MRSSNLFCVLICLLAVSSTAQQSDELNFASGLEQFQDIRRMLPNYLDNIGYRMLAERKAQMQRISSMQDVNQRRDYLRQRMLDDLGGFPERTPLNARMTGVIERPKYRVEKIIFESQPRFYVTANLYLPKSGHPPYPAILFPLGHERGGKANPTWQQMLGSLAAKGYVALTWDPIGQGERVQIYDEDLWESKLGDSTTEHTIVGAQCLLTGDHIARYTIWDGLRALDYLLSRKEVDPERVGLTGNSGGGTHTAYIAALDDRIKVAAPSCYITSWNLMLRTIGPQDGEQVFPLWLRDGIDYPDYLYAFAPKPYLVLSAIRDFFPIAGARETYAEAARVYAAIGASEKVGMFEADDGHGYNKGRRLAAYDWFARWLKGGEDHNPEPEIEMSTPEELYATPTGQVATSLGGENVFTLNLKRLEQAQASRLTKAEDIVRKARELAHYEVPSAPLEQSPYGTLSRPGYHIERLIYESEPGILIPSLLFVPDGGATKKPALLMITEDGKADSSSETEQFVKAGLIVLSIDARGFGETRVTAEVNSRDFDHYFGDYDDAMTALLVGKTMIGMRALDVTRGIDLLSARQDVDSAKVYVYGKDGGAVPALYAAAFDDRIRKLVLESMMSSYESIVKNRIHRQVFENIVPRALRYYDLPNLVATLAPREVWIVNANNPIGHALPASEISKEYGTAANAFRQAGAEKAIHMMDRRFGVEVSTIYRELTDNH